MILNPYSSKLTIKHLFIFNLSSFIYWKNMGNHINKHKQILSLIDVEFNPVRRFNHQTYGQVTLIQNKKLEIFALVQKQALIPQQFELQLLSIQKRNKSYQVAVLKWYSYKVQVCSGMKIYYIVMEYIQKSLEQQISKRQQTYEYFKYEQIIKILYQFIEIIIDQSNKLNKKGRYQISNKYMLLASHLKLKIIPSDIILKDKNQHFYQIGTFQNQFQNYLYLAPQVLQMLKNNQYIQAYEKNNSQASLVFTVGMCFIQLSTLLDLSIIYDYNSKIIHTDKIDNFTIQIKQIYNIKLFSIISKMIKANVNQRPSLTQIKMNIQQLKNEQGDLINHLLKNNSVVFKKYQENRIFLNNSISSCNNL